MDTTPAQKSLGGRENGHSGFDENSRTGQGITALTGSFLDDGLSNQNPRYDQRLAPCKTALGRQSNGLLNDPTGSPGHVNDTLGPGGSQDGARNHDGGNWTPESEGIGSIERDAHAVASPRQPFLSTSGLGHIGDVEPWSLNLTSEPSPFTNKTSDPTARYDISALYNGSNQSSFGPEGVMDIAGKRKRDNHTHDFQTHAPSDLASHDEDICQMTDPDVGNTLANSGNDSICGTSLEGPNCLDYLKNNNIGRQRLSENGIIRDGSSLQAPSLVTLNGNDLSSFQPREQPNFSSSQYESIPTYTTVTPATKTTSPVVVSSPQSTSENRSPSTSLQSESATSCSPSRNQAQVGQAATLSPACKQQETKFGHNADNENSVNSHGREVGPEGGCKSQSCHDYLPSHHSPQSPPPDETPNNKLSSLTRGDSPLETGDITPKATVTVEGRQGDIASQALNLWRNPSPSSERFAHLSEPTFLTGHRDLDLPVSHNVDELTKNTSYNERPTTAETPAADCGASLSITTRTPGSGEQLLDFSTRPSSLAVRRHDISSEDQTPLLAGKSSKKDSNASNHDLVSSAPYGNDNKDGDDDDSHQWQGDYIADEVESFPFDLKKPRISGHSIELEPLLSSDKGTDQHENKHHKMALPILESYQQYGDMKDSNVNSNGYVHSKSPENKLDFQRKGLSVPKAVNSRAESNGVAVSDAPDRGHSKVSKSLSTQGSTYDDEDNEDDDAVPCGWGPLQVECCQRFRIPKWFLLVITLCGACQGMAINGFVNTVISTIEKRFEISSTESGLIASCYDIMFVLLVIPISYFGGLGHKPRYLGIGIFILGVGSFVFCLPHFITDNYDVGNAEDTVCKINSTSPTSCNTGSASLSNYKYFFFLGQLLHGAGATALYTLGVVYMDENVPQRYASVYNGIFYTGAIVGPAIGYITGAEFLKIYTDVGVDPKTLGLNVNNPKWVGAWWIGFLISGTMAFLLSLPLLAFPPALPGSKKFALERGKESQAQKRADETGQSRGIRDILMSIKLLLTNVPFMLINIAAAADGILVGGFSTFMPKFIEYQFGVTSSNSALFVGLAVVPAGGGATFLGGFLVTYFNLKVRGILRLCAAAAFFLVLATLTLVMQCGTGSFAGVNTDYQSETHLMKDVPSKQLVSSCNRDCNCKEEDYFPMCGKDGLLYFSPCYAGCTQVKDDGSTKFYYNCSCLNYNFTTAGNMTGHMYDGEFGKCDNQCYWLITFMILFSVMIVLMFITSMPSLTATLRCVPDHQRSFGLGIQWIVARCLGSIPGPILFGKMFDLACQLWQQKCDESGSCFFYDNEDMRVNLLAVSLVFSFIAALAFFLANWFYKPKPKDDAIHLEFKHTKESFRVSQNTILPETPTTPEVREGQALS